MKTTSELTLSQDGVFELDEEGNHIMTAIEGALDLDDIFKVTR